MRVLTRQQRVSRRRANRGRGVSVGKSTPLRGKPVNVWRLYFRRFIASQVAIAEVVCKDQNNIRCVLSCECGTCRQ